MTNDRVQYSEIKSWVLEGFWDGCRDHAPLSGRRPESIWTIEQIASDVYDGYAGGVGSFDSPVEYLMLEVVSLVLSCWYPERASYHRARIYDMLQGCDINEVLKDVPVSELEEFKHDLAILGILRD